MANETTTSETSSFWQNAQQYVQTEKREIAAFVKGLIDQKKAFQEGKFNSRSWVKESPTGGFDVKLGKIPTKFGFAKKEQVIKFLEDAANAAKQDNEFIAEIEKAYGTPLGEEPVKRRGRKSKAAGPRVGNG